MSGLRSFFKFNLWAFLYLFLGPLVGLGVAAAVYAITGNGVIAVLDVAACTAYAWWFSCEAFRTYPDRLKTYRSLRHLYMTHSEVKKSLLWELKKRPCGDLVVSAIEKEFGFVLETNS